MCIFIQFVDGNITKKIVLECLSRSVSVGLQLFYAFAGLMCEQLGIQCLFLANRYVQKNLVQFLFLAKIRCVCGIPLFYEGGKDGGREGERLKTVEANVTFYPSYKDYSVRCFPDSLLFKPLIP